ncbi:MAG: ADP-ribosylglycohydrolase family protein [Candidatus Lokiarchaeota archaeon]|nr:ADP-ribosylglycohydrolase family protein [Candidatus Lokiarchaeota archaeon]
MKVNYLDKFQGTFIGVAIGDTLGYPFEGFLRSDIYSRFVDFEDYIFKNKSLFKTYTDDTQLTLHVAQALIRGNGYNANNLVNEFVMWLDDPPIGPGYGCISSIRKLKYGTPWREAASNSGGNGAAMRIAPMGLFYSRDIDSLKKAVLDSCSLTHSHPAASAGALVIARAISFLLFQDPKQRFSTEEFINVISEPVNTSSEETWREMVKILRKVQNSLHLSLEEGLVRFSQAGVKPPYFIEDYIGEAFVHPYTLSTVACSIFVFLKRLDSFKDCILELSTSGGDCDTVGAIGGSLAGAFFGLKRIPSEFIKLVRNQKKILNTSEELCKSFLKRYSNQYYK